MRKSHILFYSALFFGGAIVSIALTVRALTDISISTSLFGESKDQLGHAQTCFVDSAKIEGMAQAESPVLSKIDEYQTVCDSRATNGALLFSDMPNSEVIAMKRAQEMAATLLEFDSFGIRPYVILEPISEQWGPIDFEEFDTGFYDQWLHTYFQTLSKLGITDQQMGAWFPFPEPHQPFWNNNESRELYAQNVNRSVKIMRTYFKEMKIGILLDSVATVDSTGSISYPSLLAYARLLDKNMIDIVGIQGFPWVPPKSSSSDIGIVDAQAFLPIDQINELAEFLGKNEIFINTGVFRQRYTQNPSDTVALTVDQRRDMFADIIDNLRNLRNSNPDYIITVNIFAENKTDTTEATNWSFWSSTDIEYSLHRQTFVDAVNGLRELGADISLYDRS